MMRKLLSLALVLVTGYYSFMIPMASAGPSSSNFELKSYGFGAGGDTMSSANYKAFGTAGEVAFGDPSSANYKANAGLIYTVQASVPPPPTFTNPDNYYNKLQLVINTTGNSASDTQFAVAISTDDFAADTKYIQSDYSVGATLGDEDWLTYSGVGGFGGASGVTIIGLQSGTTYTVKVAARQGNYTQSGFGPTAQAATVEPTISFSLNGVSSGTTIDGAVTDITTTNTAAGFGELSVNSVAEGATRLRVSTNAVSGYTVTVAQTGDLMTNASVVFPQVSGTNTTPSSWPSSPTTGAYGYHSSDHVLGTGTPNRFATNNTFAKFESTAYEVAYADQPVTNEDTYVLYSIEAGPGQTAGSYAHTIVYVASGLF